MDRSRQGAEADAAAAEAAQAATATQQGAPAKDAGQQAQAPKADGGRLTKEQWDALPAPFRARVNELQRAVKEQGPAVKAYNDLQTWARNSGISQDEFTFGLELISAMRNDPRVAWEMLQPSLAVLRKHVGEELSEDLQADVTAGTISPERARELAAARAERVRLEHQGRRREAADEQRAAQDEHRRIHGTMKNAIAGYETQWKASDPDYPKKMERVKNEFYMRLIARRQAGTPVSTPQEAVELLKAARKDIEMWMTGFLPPPKAKETLPAGGTSAQTRVEPQNALEAAKLGLARFHRQQARTAA